MRCRGVGRAARLREHVATVDFEAASTSALLHHPFRPLLVGVDGRGTVRVYHTRHAAFVNAFHLAEGRPTSVAALWQLNETQVGWGVSSATLSPSLACLMQGAACPAAQHCRPSSN